MRRFVGFATCALALVLLPSTVGACDFFGVTTDAAIRETYGLKAVYAGNTSDCFVRDDSPNNETTYSAQFLLENQVTALGDGHQIFRVQGDVGGTTVFQVVFREIPNGEDFIFVYAFRDDGSRSRVLTSRTPEGTRQHYKFDWQAASAPGANDGFLRVYKARADGSWNCLKEVVGIDNDTREVDRALLGSFTGLDAATIGEFYFDNFESYRTVESSPTCVTTFVD